MTTHSLAALCALCLAIAPAGARGATIEYTFSGNVGERQSEVPVSVGLGEPFRVVVTFHDAPNLCLQPGGCSPAYYGGTRGSFQGSGSLQLGSTLLEDLPFGAGTYDGFTDPFSPGLHDSFALGADLGQLLSLEPAEFRMYFETWPAIAPGSTGPLTSAELPTTFSLDDWPAGSLLVVAFYRDGAQIGEVNASVTYANARVVPEPAVAALAGAALVVLSARRRARARAAPRSGRR